MTSPPRYGFCPYDGTPLSRGSDFPTCAECGFVDYGNPKPCVAILVERQGKILLARRAVDPRKGFWDIPGGFIEPGESAEEAVARELKEETALRVKTLRYLMSVADSYGPHDTATLNFCFTVTIEDWFPKAADDVAELRLFSADGIPSRLAFEHQEILLEAWIQQSGSSLQQ